MGRTPLKAPAKGVTKVSCLMRPASEPVMFCQGDSCTLPSPRLRCHSVQKGLCGHAQHHPPAAHLQLSQRPGTWQAGNAAVMPAAAVAAC